LQVKLLRVLQNGSVRRVGENAERPVDVRVVAATNRPLDQMVARGEFREDLFFRLNVVHLHLPPLRERGDDLQVLLKANLQRFSQRLGKDLTGFSPEAWDALTGYYYPGNIRELENIVHHAALMAEGAQILRSDLPPYLQARLALGPAQRPGAEIGAWPMPDPGGTQGLERAAQPSSGGEATWAAPAIEVPSSAWVQPTAPARGAALRAPSLDLGDGFLTLAEMEKQLIEATLRRLKGNQSVAAKKLGISRSTLWRKMKEYGLEA
jgi:two-component system nitrogen regulation response regulator GlnG